MVEKLLPYDRSVVPQETGYWCGPAATQIVLNSRGIIVPEAQLAKEIGTHTGGTDNVGWIERSLDARVPDAHYTSVYLRKDPPDREQRERLWAHLKQSIDSGWGVVLNWWAPDGNKPRGIKGSVSPRYSSGMTKHYVAGMGYDDDYDGRGSRAVWIADSGFNPQGYWIDFQQCATLIPPQGYCYAAAVTEPQPPPPSPSRDQVAMISELFGASVSMERYRQLLPFVRDALQRSNCTNVKRIAMWFAQIGHECVGLKYMRELWGPTAQQLTYQGRMGNTNPGDGQRYLGRGVIQVTGKDNYRALTKWSHDTGQVPLAISFVNTPELLEADQYAFLGAIWYWTVARPQINSLCDASDLDAVTRAINGGTHGIADRRERWNRALAFGDRLLDLINDTTGDGFLMALTNAEQREMLDLMRQQAKYRRKSLSPFRWPGEGEVNTCAGFAWTADAHGHFALVEKLAVTYGDPQSVAMLQAVALCGENPKQYPDRQADAVLAARVLARVADSAQVAGKAYLQAWFDAEKR